MRSGPANRRRPWLSRLGLIGGLALGTVTVTLPRLLGWGPDATLVLILAAAAAMGAVILFGLLAFPRRWRRLSRSAAAWRTLRCVQCDYDLRGVQTPVCPECGRESPELARWLTDAPDVLRALRDSSRPPSP